MKYLLTAISLSLLWVLSANAAILSVNKSYGPYRSVSAAVSAANDGDTVLITDSSIYYESVNLNKNDIKLKGSDGQQPILSGQNMADTEKVIWATADNIVIEQVVIIVGGAYSGICSNGGTITITGCEFDLQVPNPTANFAIEINNSDGIKNINNCSFYGLDNVEAGGIIVNTSTAITMTVNQCDFWGFGSRGGMIGLGVPTNSDISIHNSCFANYSTTGGIVAINSWGNNGITITETNNTLYNITIPISTNVNGGAFHNTSESVTGNANPTDSQLTINLNDIDHLLGYYGVDIASGTVLKEYTGPRSLDYFLKKSIRWIEHDFFRGFYDSVLGMYWQTHTIDFMANTGVRHWDQFEHCWGRGYTPADWHRIKIAADEVRQTVPILGGSMMESIRKNNVKNTPIPNKFWTWLIQYGRTVSMRPMEVKWVNGQRYQAHFFDYDTMLGTGVDFWAPDESVPNINKQEGILWYLYLSMNMIDSGMNQIAVGQPQKTFGQDKFQSGFGGQALRMVSKFAKNYGLEYGPDVEGTRFVTFGANTVVYYLSDYCDYVDFVISPYGANWAGIGNMWPNGLEDSWDTIPPSSAGLPGKPLCLQLDTSVADIDQINAFVKANPYTRNQWLVDYTNHVRDTYGYYNFMPGVTPYMPIDTQVFTGYILPPTGYPWRYNFLPWQDYSGCENTIRDLHDDFDPTGSITINYGNTVAFYDLLDLTITANDQGSGVSKMRLKIDGNWTEWMHYSESFQVRIDNSSYGTKTVSLQLQDSVGNISSTYFDSIIFTMKGDFDGDLDVSFEDIAYFAKYWLDHCLEDHCRSADTNLDGYVDLSDFSEIVSNW